MDRIHDAAIDELQSAQPDSIAIQAKLHILQQKIDILVELDKKFLDAILDADSGDIDIDKEMEKADQYSERKVPWFLPKNLKEVIDPVILRYFAQPEDILLGMLGDTRHYIWELAVRRIFEARSSNIQQSLRQFEVPNSLNMNASSYMDLIDWSTLVITEPPLTMGYPVEVLIDIVKNPDTSMLFSEIKSYPCHTQAVERDVKIVTDASATVCGSGNRDGVMRAKLESRGIIPSFGSKQDYKLSLICSKNV
ncbi:hypothetical protein JTB14_019544 [Gonioctena quinquepunctata]|nr:hypothetical protein JTB14_019544 [Gonioctena quinquepunctata]